MQIDVNNIEVREYTKHLRKMHRSNFPIVVRQTLNNMAFDVKKNTLLPSADKKFILRNPSFFKKHSGVKTANGFDINSMRAEVGIISSNSIAAKQLTKQEFGGKISNRSMIYMDQARVSGSKQKRVRRPNYIGTKGVVKGKPKGGYGSRSRKSNFVAASFVALKENKNVKWENTLYDIKSLRFQGKGANRKAKIKAVPIADYEANRSVTLQARPFLKPASMLSYNKANAFFIANARKRLEKR